MKGNTKVNTPKPRKASKSLSFWQHAILWLLGSGSVLSFLGLIIYNAYEFIHDDRIWINDLKNLALLDIIMFPLIALTFHAWSILFLKAFNHDIQAKGQRNCHYCGYPATGPAICTECSSIQWPALGALEAVAVFTAQHRWNLLAAYFFLFIATPLSFIYGMKEEKEKFLRGEQERLLQIETGVNQLRALILSMESSIRPNIDKDKYADCLFRYMQFTWDVSDRLQNFLSINKRAYPKIWDICVLGTKLTDTSASKGDIHVNLIRTAIHFVDGESIDLACQKQFKKYCTTVMNYAANSDARQRNRLLFERKKAALELTARLKVANAIISIIALYDQDDNKKQQHQDVLDDHYRPHWEHVGKDDYAPDVRMLKEMFPIAWPTALDTFISQPSPH